jgi:hypothetical protein
VTYQGPWERNLMVGEEKAKCQEERLVIVSVWRTEDDLGSAQIIPSSQDKFPPRRRYYLSRHHQRISPQARLAEIQNSLVHSPAPDHNVKND